MKTFLKFFLPAACLAALLALAARPALAQSALTLHVNKDFGYNAGGDIRGTFTLTADGPADLAAVVFLLDGREIGRAEAAPFSLKINTDDYAPGDHILQARGQLSSGSAVDSQERTFRFLNKDEEAAGMRNILFPLLGLVAVITVAGFAIQIFMARGKQPGGAGAGGSFSYRSGYGAVCPRCQLPTQVHPISINLGFMTKFDRCDNCGKWSLMRVRSPKDMQAYISTLQAQGQARVQPESEEEKLRRQLDDSKYTRD